jgi:hypothetical protein
LAHGASSLSRNSSARLGLSNQYSFRRGKISDQLRGMHDTGRGDPEIVGRHANIGLSPCLELDLGLRVSTSTVIDGKSAVSEQLC